MVRRTTLVLLLAWNGVSCTSSTPRVDASSDASAGAADEGDGAAGAAGQFKPQLPEVLSLGGPVIAQPKFFIATYDVDPARDSIEAFFAALTTAPYWTDVGRDYGVGAASIGRTVHLPEAPPALLTRDQIAPFLADRLDGTHPEWGTPDDNALYAFLLPPGTELRLPAGSCPPFGTSPGAGFHGFAKLENGSKVPFVVFARCPGSGGSDRTELEELTLNLSHDLMEAATDPFASVDDPASPKTYWTVADPFMYWTGFPNTAEVGDLCDLDPTATTTAPVPGFLVERIWANSQAKLGHNPCIPAPQGYFAAVPILTDTLPFQSAFGASIWSGTTRGVRVAVGQTKTIDVALYSDSPTESAWTVSAFPYSPFGVGEEELNLALDKNTGAAGETLHLQVTALKAGPYGGSLFILYSALPDGRASYWPGYVGN